MSFSDIANRIVDSTDRYSFPIINLAKNALHLVDWCVLAGIISQISVTALSLLAGEVTTAIFVANAAIFAAQLATPLILLHITLASLSLFASAASLSSRAICHLK